MEHQIDISNHGCFDHPVLTEVTSVLSKSVKKCQADCCEQCPLSVSSRHVDMYIASS